MLNVLPQSFSLRAILQAYTGIALPLSMDNLTETVGYEAELLVNFFLNTSINNIERSVFDSLIKKGLSEQFEFLKPEFKQYLLTLDLNELEMWVEDKEREHGTTLNVYPLQPSEGLTIEELKTLIEERTGRRSEISDLQTVLDRFGIEHGELGSDLKKMGFSI